jgi:fused signal recognition particle receptor
MEYVILIIVIAVLAVATGGWLLFVRPRGGRTLEAPKPQTPPAAQATTTPAGSGDAESSAVPDTPAAATGVLEVERPPPSAGRMVRLRARLARSQSSKRS